MTLCSDLKSNVSKYCNFILFQHIIKKNNNICEHYFEHYSNNYITFLIDILKNEQWFSIKKIHVNFDYKLTTVIKNIIDKVSDKFIIFLFWSFDIANIDVIWLVINLLKSNKMETIIYLHKNTHEFIYKKQNLIPNFIPYSNLKILKYFCKHVWSVVSINDIDINIMFKECVNSFINVNTQEFEKMATYLKNKYKIKKNVVKTMQLLCCDDDYFLNVHNFKFITKCFLLSKKYVANHCELPVNDIILDIVKYMHTKLYFNKRDFEKIFFCYDIIDDINESTNVIKYLFNNFDYKINESMTEQFISQSFNHGNVELIKYFDNKFILKKQHYENINIKYDDGYSTDVINKLLMINYLYKKNKNYVDDFMFCFLCDACDNNDNHAIIFLCEQVGIAKRYFTMNECDIFKTLFLNNNAYMVKYICDNVLSKCEKCNKC